MLAPRKPGCCWPACCWLRATPRQLHRARPVDCPPGSTAGNASGQRFDYQTATTAPCLKTGCRVIGDTMTVVIEEKPPRKTKKKPPCRVNPAITPARQQSTCPCSPA